MQELQEILVQFLGQEDPWRRAWQPTLVFLPGEFQGQRSLVGSSPWGHKELDMTEVTNTSLCQSQQKHFPSCSTDFIINILMTKK